MDIFVHDRLTGSTVRASVASDGSEGNSSSVRAEISGSGEFVAFESFSSNLVPQDADAQYDVFVWNRLTGQTSLVSQVAGSWPAISETGRYITYGSGSSGEVSGDSNGQPDIFIFDTVTGSRERVSVSASGAQVSEGAVGKSSVSADGQIVAFSSNAADLEASPDTNGMVDIFVRDRAAGTTQRVSVSSSGVQANQWSWKPSVSADGRFVAFESFASNLVVGDTNGDEDAFVRDRSAGTTSAASVSSSGTIGNSNSFSPTLSHSGRYVVFRSGATNLVTGDTNNRSDVFVRDLGI